MAAGLLGGGLSLVYGAMGFWLAAVQPAAGLEVLCLLTMLAGLAGAVMVVWRPMAGAALLASAVATLGLMGLNFFAAAPVLLFGAAAGFGVVVGRRWVHPPALRESVMMRYRKMAEYAALFRPTLATLAVRPAAGSRKPASGCKRPAIVAS